MEPIAFKGSVKSVNVKALASSDVGARVTIDTNECGGLEVLVGKAVSVVIKVMDDPSEVIS